MTIHSPRLTLPTISALALALLLAACSSSPSSTSEKPDPDGGGDNNGEARPPDTGQRCDPEAEVSPCNHLCHPDEEGGGTCLDLCGASNGVDCPSGFQCSLLFDEDGEPYELCLPGSLCGDLTYQGMCEGDVLRYCGLDGPQDVDCAEITTDDGAPWSCELVDDTYGHDCVEPPPAPDGCGEETVQGRCDGDTVVVCQSLESGIVERIDCLVGEECGVAPDGTAECRKPGSTGCGAVTYQGYCEGTVAVWCDTGASEILTHDCDESSQTCDWVDDEIGYWCVDGGSTTGTWTATGRFLFERPELTEDGLGAVRQVPIRRAQVQVRSAADDTVLASHLTGDDGTFTIGFDATGEVYVAVLATANDERYAISVRDCPTGDCGGLGNVYGAASEAFAPGEATDVGTLVIPHDGVAGAFNIFDVFSRGFDFAREHIGQRPPAIVGQWRRGQDTACGTSCFSTRNGNTIYVLSTNQDTDEFDDPVLGHELGHFLESAFSRSDSPGGSHDGTATDPRLAWGEGYGTWIGSTIFDSPVYIDSFASGASVTDIGRTGHVANDAGPMTQLVSEFLVAEILWALANDGASPIGPGSAIDVLGRYFPSTQLVDRGVGGVDLVDFLDGWFCRGHENRALVERVVNTDRLFPYDFGGPAICN